MLCNFVGVSARHLPIDWMTMTEVLRISLMSSGYFTGPGTHRFRLFSRGAVHFFEDEGFVFANSNPNAMKTLEKVYSLLCHYWRFIFFFGI